MSKFRVTKIATLKWSSDNHEGYYDYYCTESGEYLYTKLHRKDSSTSVTGYISKTVKRPTEVWQLVKLEITDNE